MSGSRWMRLFLCAWVGFFLGSSASLSAAEPDDLAKQIEKNLSSIGRNIATSPSRAEQQMIETRKLIAQLKAAAPNHAKLAGIEKTASDLTAKLERRLGHPIGGSAAQEESKPATPAKPSTPSSLPSSVASRLKQIETNLNAVVTALEKNQLQTAVTKLKQARKLMDEVQSRYGDKIPAGDPEMKATTDRLTAVGTRYDQARSAADADAAAVAAAKQHQLAQSREWLDKFAPFTTYNSEQYLSIGASFARLTEEEKARCLQAFDKANQLMAEYEKTEFPHGRTQELTFAGQHLAGILAIHNEGAARARQEEACRSWVEKLRSYVDVGAGGRKYLVGGVTLSESDIQQRAALLEEAQALWPEYEKAEFPLGKTAQLLDLEEAMKERLAEMPEELRRSRALISGDIEKEFDRVLGRLTQDTGWKDDTTKKPNLVMARDVTSLQQALDRYAGTVKPDDAMLVTLKQKLAQIKDQDQKNRAVRAERTFMTPDGFAGEEEDALREKVGEIVKERSADGKALRITLPAEDWREESVLEWTDTTHSELRHRITRFMSAQAATKDKDGKVYLHGVHLAQDRQSDGQWGPLYGHVMWSDWMAEQNVDEIPPQP